MVFIVQWCKRSSINTTLTKFLEAEERFMFGIGMLLPAGSCDVSVLESSPLNTVSELTATRKSSTSGWSWESSLGERTVQTETGNQVGSFMFKSRSF